MKTKPNAIHRVTAVLALAALGVKAGSDPKTERQREENQIKARNRAAEDSRHYKPAELAEIESLWL